MGQIAVAIIDSHPERQVLEHRREQLALVAQRAFGVVACGRFRAGLVAGLIV